MPLDNDTTHQLNTLAADRLDGAKAISIFYFGDASPENVKRTYRLREKGAPIGKRGRNIISTKQKLAAWDDAMTNGHLKGAE